MSCEPQLRRAGAVAVVVDAGAADRAAGSSASALFAGDAAAADHAVFAHPHRLAVALDHVRRALGLRHAAAATPTARAAPRERSRWSSQE